jgi:hypothetical protein
MIEKLKTLPFVSLRETTDLDKSDILFIDFSLNENNEKQAQVFCKTIYLASLEIEDINILPKLVLDMFIQRVDMNIKSENIINIDSKLLDKIDDLISLTMDKFTDTLLDENRKFSNTNKFAIVSENLKTEKMLLDINKLHYGEVGGFYDIAITDKIENEIIFGYKTKVDQPGIILITNEEGLKDNKNIKIAISDLGFHPENAYFKIKIQN